MHSDAGSSTVKCVGEMIVTKTGENATHVFGHKRNYCSLLNSSYQAMHAKP